MDSKNTFRYTIGRENNNCPICNYRLISEYDKSKIKLCSSFKRITIKSFLWWKTICTYPGVHWHSKCSKCKCHWLTIHPNNKQEIHNLIIS